MEMNMLAEVLIIIFMIALSLFFMLDVVISKRDRETLKDKMKEKELLYDKPINIDLTQYEIDAIHSRGKITPAEKVREWEGLGLCAPGDAIGSASSRCKRFKNCHECLMDYANQSYEYTSFEDTLKNLKLQKFMGEHFNE